MKSSGRHSLVAGDAPLGRGRLVEHEHAAVTLEAAGHAERGECVLARRVRALVAAHALTHLGEGCVVVAVGAQRVALKHTQAVGDISYGGDWTCFSQSQGSVS
jgi:hypothetical protein